MEITDDDITKAEKIFLKSGQSFDEERRAFIKCLDKSVHVQACPGSGKTTALLAKLYILSEKMPFKNNQGICVLTHTNVAIDIIKKNLGERADLLFRHPNFFGTIQSFIDKYLAIPAFIKCYGHRPRYIDDDFFYERMLKDRAAFEKNDWLKHNKNRWNNVVDFVFYGIHTVFQDFSNNGFDLKIKIGQHTSTYMSIKEVFQKIFASGYIRFNDAFSLAGIYLKKYPEIRQLFSSRFRYVFVDEAQDTSTIQKEIIEKCFNENENVIIQWLGDANQGIMNSNEEESAWNPEENSRYSVMNFTKSHRISQPVANLIKNVAARPYDSLSGTSIGIKPVLILFTDSSKEQVEQVLDKFAQLVYEKKCIYEGEEKTLYEISQLSGNPIKAVGWVGKEKKNGLSIKSYFPGFDKQLTNRRRLYFPNLYTMCELSKNVSPKELKERILNCILEALYLSDVQSDKKKKYTKNEFLKYVKETRKELLNRLFKYIVSYYKFHDFDKLSKRLCILIKKMGFDLKKNARDYLIGHESKDIPVIPSRPDYNNIFNIFKKTVNDSEINIYIDTVHGVKGETHTATLYLETMYYENSIEHFREEMNGQRSNSHKKVKIQALKIAHVAFSRPTHLLCIAIPKHNFKKPESDLYEVISL
ncbi:MAG TPA: UvrD-helicase domain-containing protein [Anaerohalosphaeraceae bacterium]|nr:UvrD-helicase domain-containing protein [Anaerohalosphaeraceae bacterium]